ncbi:hypothetical protein EVAR_47969_1 [Eumeta japonica]|uniref:Uncharacterized protein n=1 Tax=Eumeta variegata TaxID=151549 RepID=A0A4C1X8N8_EUMVA|nr:hypothetical protein EVAR_47969_1 [Eumeta japonica]
MGRQATKAELCDRNNTVDITDGTVQADDSVSFQGVVYPNGTWFEVFENGRAVRLGCACTERGCIWKCCGLNEELLGRKCVPTARVFNPSVYRGREITPIVASEHFNYIYSIPCSQRYLVDTDMGNELYLQEVGWTWKLFYK